jgi:hypothetical protein
MSFESAVRTMLTTGSTISLVPDARITLGYRLQDSALPAITYDCQTTELTTIGATPERSAVVDVRAIAVQSLDAIAISEQIRNACVAGTYSSIVFSAVVEIGRQLDDAVVSDGDEAQPAEHTNSYLIYYTE